jgi:hypothetical protein
MAQNNPHTGSAIISDFGEPPDLREPLETLEPLNPWNSTVARCRVDDPRTERQELSAISVGDSGF